MDRQEDCRLIAEFLGWNKSLGITYHKDKKVTTIKHFDFVANGDWNGLMGVVEKINNTGRFEVIIQYGFCYITDGQGELTLACPEKNTIYAVYKAVVEFIKWYKIQTN